MDEPVTISATLAKELAKEFDQSKVQIKPAQGGLKYISHGIVTERLLSVDPNYTFEILDIEKFTDEKGVPHVAGVTVALTILGSRKEEAGGPQRYTTYTNDLKNSVSDAIKRAAMRFGVALAMWEDLIDAQDDEDVTEKVRGEDYIAEGAMPDLSKQVVKRTVKEANAKPRDPTDIETYKATPSESLPGFLQKLNRAALLSIGLYEKERIGPEQMLAYSQQQGWEQGKFKDLGEVQLREIIAWARQQ